MFERTLESLIKGLRSHRGADEVNFVSKLSKEIRDELKSGEMEVKAGAVLKLTYVSPKRLGGERFYSTRPKWFPYLLSSHAAANVRLSASFLLVVFNP